MCTAWKVVYELLKHTSVLSHMFQKAFSNNLWPVCILGKSFAEHTGKGSKNVQDRYVYETDQEKEKYKQQRGDLSMLCGSMQQRRAGREHATAEESWEGVEKEEICSRIMKLVNF